MKAQRRIRSRSWTWMVVAVAMALFMTACGNGEVSPDPVTEDDPEPPPAEEDTAPTDDTADEPDEAPADEIDTVVRLGYISNWWQPILGVAVEEGMFADAGLEVEARSFEGGPDIVEAMAAGEIDISSIGMLPPLIAHHRGAVDLSWYPVFDINALYAMLARSEYEELSDLEGGSFVLPVGTMGQLWVELAMEKEGLDPAAVNYIDTPIPDAGVVFAAGNGDAAVINPNELTTVMRQTDSVIIYQASDLFEGEGALDIQLPDGIVVTEAFASEHPEAVERFWDVWFNTIVPWFMDDATHDEAVATLNAFFADRFGLELQPEDVEFLAGGTVLPDLAEYTAYVESGAPVSSLETVAEFMTEQGAMDGVPDDLDAYVSTDNLPSP